MSNSVRSHRWQPTRLPRPWDSPGKNTGVGCRFLLQCMKLKSESEFAQLCPTLGYPMECSLPGSSFHRIPWKSTGVGCHHLLPKIPGVTGKFDLGVQSEAGQRLTEFSQENALVITPSSNNTIEDYIYGHHQMVNTKIKLIIFFAAKDGKALYSQQKQDRELTVAQIMNSLLQNSDKDGKQMYIQ